jgi:hypothetical protein
MLLLRVISLAPAEVYDKQPEFMESLDQQSITGCMGAGL